MAQHNISTASVIRRGAAAAKGDSAAGKERGSLGIVSSHLLYYSFGTPVVGAANSISLSQSVTIATTPLALLNGSTAGVLDVARNVVAAWTGTAVLTITGLDQHGAVVVESSASGVALTGKKAFKSVTSASFSANVTGATIGTGDVLGFPYVIGAGDVLLKFAGSTADTGTVVTAVTTNPATATTGDVRGTIDPSTTLDGSTEIQVLINLPYTDANAYGVAQYAG